jgi:hypothetical protein
MKDENVNWLIEPHESHSTPSAKTYQMRISFELDKGFITIWPAISLNLHSKTIEINWLVFGMYIDF